VLATSAPVQEQRPAVQANAASTVKALELERVLALLDDAEQVCACDGCCCEWDFD